MARGAPVIPTSAVLDTSVIVKWYRQHEAMAKAALVLRDRYLHGETTIAVPTLLIYELANVLRYQGDLTIRQVQEATQSLLDFGLRWIAPSDSLIRRAIEIAREFDITVYDAVFAAVAEMLDAALVTADEKLAHRLASLGFVVYLGELR